MTVYGWINFVMEKRTPRHRHLGQTHALGDRLTILLHISHSEFSIYKK